VVDSPDLVPRSDADSINFAEGAAFHSDAVSVGSWIGVVLVEETAGATNADAVYSCSQDRESGWICNLEYLSTSLCVCSCVVCQRVTEAIFDSMCEGDGELCVIRCAELYGVPVGYVLSALGPCIIQLWF
jgi:hypothetical protein